MNHLRTLLLLLLAVGLLTWCWRQSRPQVFPDVPHGQFACLSYSPPGDDALEPGTDAYRQVVRAQIERDLQQLSVRTHCVRTYSVANELDYVPEVARRLGMRVLLGLWVSRNAGSNETEIAHGIEVAKANRDVIDAVVVGNEVLLRHEQSAGALQGLLTRVHTETQLPVTYADVWEFWLRNPQLAQSVDFITIHILPYWEDFPIDIDHALDHVRNVYDKVAGQFPGKRILVGEVGWPSAGRQRQGAIPSLMNQARFTREFIAFADAGRIPYNFIEAYDQPWKRGLEGTVGGNWGLYTADGREKFALTGSLIPDPHWWRGWLTAVAGALLMGLWSWFRHRDIGAGLGNALLGAALGTLLVLQWQYVQEGCRNEREWLAMSLFALTGFLIVLCEVFAPDEHLTKTLTRWRSVLWLIFLVMLAYINLGLTFESRYRDFPSIFLALPLVTVLFARIEVSPHWQGVAQLLVGWLCLSALLIPLLEKLTNHSALIWSGLCLLTGGRWLWLLRTGFVRQEHRAE